MKELLKKLLSRKFIVMIFWDILAVVAIVKNAECQTVIISFAGAISCLYLGVNVFQKTKVNNQTFSDKEILDISNTLIDKNKGAYQTLADQN